MHMQKRIWTLVPGLLITGLIAAASVLLPVSPALAQQAKPLIKIIATGGTIANTTNGRIPFDQVLADIRRQFPSSQKVLDSVTLQVVEVTRVGSESLSGADYLSIARAVNNAVHEPDVKGVIVTHGTSTTEDTAYFLQLLVRSDKPVVITNSMHKHGDLGNDGDKNFMDAISVVLSPQAVGKGVLLVTNESINSGREVQKTSARFDGFKSGEYGLLGIIDEDRPEFYRAPTRRHTSRSEFDINAITTLPKVEIISTYYDADPALITLAGQGAKGIVLNGFTPGGTPFATQAPALEALAAKGVIVVTTSRGGINNRIPETRTDDRADKFVHGDNLSATKARILLQLALTKTSDPKEIQRIFNEY
jgi:L-asparaginase type II